MRKIKVLHVHTLPLITGSGINTFLSMQGLNRDEYVVDLACASGGALEDEVKKSGMGFCPVKHFVQPVSLFNDFVALFELIKIIKKGKYDIVHSHNSKAGFIGRLAAKIVGTKIIIHTIHGFSFHNFETSLRRNLFIILERFAAKLADKLIVISGPLKVWGLSLGIGKEEQYTIIYSGIEIDRFIISIDINEKKKELGISENDKVIGVVAKLWEGKGHECILRAFKDVVGELSDVKLLLVGEGYLRKKLEDMVKDLGLEKHVIFTGFRSDIPEITSVFDISVLVSFFEGMGRVLLEAMALSKSVIATKVGGIVDVVDDGVTGLLIKPDDHAALKQALILLLSDNSLREKMGKAGKEKLGTRFTASMMVKQIDLVYKELLDKIGETSA